MPKIKKRADGLYQKSVTINGKRHVFYGKTQAEIMRKILNYEEKAKNGPTFKEVAEEWKASVCNELAYKTYVTYKCHAEAAIERFGSSYISDITTVDINNYITYIASKKYAFKTVKSYLSVISLIFHHAILNGYIQHNPCRDVPTPRGLSQKKRELPSDDEIKKVFSSVHCTFGLFALFVLCTGLRRGEALALTYGDIDRDKCTVSINKSIYHQGNKPVLKQPKTAAGIREVIVPQFLMNYLPPEKKKDAILFSNSDGEYIRSSHFNRLWKKYKEESGVTITPHQLRHAYATILYDAGVGDKDCQELLGHSDISVTRNIYTHISQSRSDLSRGKINDYIQHLTSAQ